MSLKAERLRECERPGKGVKRVREVGFGVSREGCFYGGAFPRSLLTKRCPGTFSQSSLYGVMLPHKEKICL